VEADVAIGEAIGSVGRVVDPMVVVAAEQDAVVEVGAPAVLPRMQVVGLAPGGGDVAALGTTDGVTHAHRQALGG
jgi:hypothetical protein